MDAYDTFADAANSGALKVVLQGANVQLAGRRDGAERGRRVRANHG